MLSKSSKIMFSFEKMCLGPSEDGLDIKINQIGTIFPMIKNDPIPIYFYVSKHLIKPWVGGFVPNIMDHTYTKDLHILSH